MRLFIASDVHGSEASLKEFFKIVDAEIAKNNDVKVILLGDTYNHGPRNPFPEGYAPMRVASLLNDAMSFVTVIKGNCDSEVDEAISNFPIISDFDMDWSGRKIYFTHGHKINADNPPSGAKAGDVVFYGHFHVPKAEVRGGVNFICVGSIGMNPQGVPKSYAVMDEEKIELKSFDGKTLERIEL